MVGIDLAALFRVILNYVQDSQEPVTAEHLTEPVRDAVTNHARVEHVYGSAVDPWAALTGDALSQLELAGLAVREADDSWRPGSNFATGKRMVVIGPRKGKHGSVGVKLYPADEREALGAAEKQRMEITSLAASMREDGRGLRPVNPEHVETLAQSMRDFGFRPEFPVLVDQHGRVLDGRHRRAAARKAAVAEPPPKVIRVGSDEEAVGFAILVNLQRGWTKAERSRIDSDLQAAGLSVENFGQVMGSAAKRELIKTALLDNPELTHRAIAKRLGVSPDTVNRVCAELMTESVISSCQHRTTEDGKQAPGSKPKPGSPFTPGVTLTPDQEQQVTERVARGASAHAIHKELGVPTHAAQLAKAKAEGRLEERAKQQPKPPPAEASAKSAPQPAPPSEQAARAVEQMVGIILSLPVGERTWAISRLLENAPQQ